MSTKSAAKRSGKRRAAPVWEQVLDEPVPSSTVERSVARRTRRMRMWVWASVILLPIALLGDIALVGSRHAATTKGVGDVSSPGEATAWATVQRWLSETPSPLPGGKILAWEGATPVAVTHLSKRASDAGGAVWHAEIDKFALAGRAGRIYQVDLEVAIGANGSAVPVGGPSVEPGPPSITSPASEGPWPGINATPSVPSTVAQAITGWADAYVSGSPSSLHLAVGDPNPADHYQPLSGVSSVTATPTWGARIGAPSANEMIVQVNLDIVWDGQQTVSGLSGSTGASSGTSGSGSAPTTTLDLLVERADSAAPVVVAWGPPGSGPTLTPYANATH